jgi:hypothetical protein
LPTQTQGAITGGAADVNDAIGSFINSMKK